jgi:hypothetical protein
LIKEDSRDCLEVRSLHSPFSESELGEEGEGRKWGLIFSINKVRAVRTFSTPYFHSHSPYFKKEASLPIPKKGLFPDKKGNERIPILRRLWYDNRSSQNHKDIYFKENVK